MLTFVIFQLIALKALSSQHFYSKYETDDGADALANSYAYETSVIADIGLAQVLIASVVSTIGHPFRIRWYENPYHVVCLVLQSIFVVYQVISRNICIILNTLALHD